MKGKILNFKAEKGFGFILGKDNQKYFFHISGVSNPMDIEEGYSVDFKTKEGKKGLSAINITVQVPLSGGRSKDKLLKIKDLRIRASDIKSYQIYADISGYELRDEDGYYYDLSDKEWLDAQYNKIEPKEKWSETRKIYTLEIKTYTSGIKDLKFISYIEEENKEEAYKWLDYIDEEMDKLI